MKTLELKQMELIEGGGCGWMAWAGFGVLVIVGVVAVAAVVSTGGAAAALLATTAGMGTANTLSIAGATAVWAGCE